MDDYFDVRSNSHEYYKKLNKVFCPALDMFVYFPSSGFNHIIYKKDRKVRDKISQVYRFKSLQNAVFIIEKSTTYQEYELINKKILIKHGEEFIVKDKEIKYWGLIAIIGNSKIKVVLRKIGNGNLQFWSVIPYWITSIKRDKNFTYSPET